MSAKCKDQLNIPAPICRILNEMNVSPIELLKNYALNQIHGRIQKYEAENSLFERKYGCTLESFRRKIESATGHEDFEWEDDLMDWEFAAASLEHWRQTGRELQAE